MKLVYKIVLVNIGIALFFGLLVTLSVNQEVDDFLVFFGLVSLVGGAIDLLVSLVLYLMGRRIWAQGYLLTAGVLLLLGSAACTTYPY